MFRRSISIIPPLNYVAETYVSPIGHQRSLSLPYTIYFQFRICIVEYQRGLGFGNLRIRSTGTFWEPANNGLKSFGLHRK